MKSVLRYLGVGLFMAGGFCMPIPNTNSEAITTIVPWLAMTGSLMKFGAVVMFAGAVLFAMSFALRNPD
jgi:hypothetical protein